MLQTGPEIRSIVREEIPQVLELVREAFTWYTETEDQANGQLHVDLFAAVYAREDIDCDLIVVAVEDGRFVSMASWLPKDVRLGEEVLRTVVLSPVGTLPACRGRGLAERVLRHGLERVQQKGYVLSAVLGHPEYYPRVGYVPAFPWHRLRVNVSAAAAEVVEMRHVQASDIASLVSVYEREMAKHLFYPLRKREWYRRELGVMLSPAEQREGHMFTNPDDFVVFEQAGTFLGYAYLGADEEALLVAECYLTEDAWAEPVYRTLETLARQRGKTSLVMSRPAVTSMGALFKTQGAEEKINAPSAWMLQVLDWNAWFRAYTAAHPLPHLTGTPLTITAEQVERNVSLTVQYGSHCAEHTLTAEALTGLTLGVHTGQSDDLLRVIFPQRPAFFNIGDALF